MTFADAIAALVILSFFFFGFSQAFLPAYQAWEKATAEYNAAYTIRFIAESFRRECEKPDRNIENWKKTASVARGLGSYHISELREGDTLRALRLVFFLSGERFEVIGLCTP